MVTKIQSQDWTGPDFSLHGDLYELTLEQLTLEGTLTFLCYCGSRVFFFDDVSSSSTHSDWRCQSCHTSHRLPGPGACSTVSIQNVFFWSLQKNSQRREKLNQEKLPLTKDWTSDCGPINTTVFDISAWLTC